MIFRNPLAVIRDYIRQAERSLKTEILWFLIPIIIFFVLLTGFLTYSLAARQIEANAYRGIGDTVSQTRKYLDNRLTAIFEQLVALENDIDTLSLIKRIDDTRYGTLHPGDYIRMDRNLERIFTSYHSILDSILVHFNNGQLILAKKDYMSSKISFNYPDWRLHYSGNRTEYYWRMLHVNDVFRSNEAENSIASVFKLYGNEESNLKGIVLFNLHESFFRSILQDAQISENGYLMVINEEGMMNFKDIPPKYQVDGNIQKLLLSQEDSSGKLAVRNANGQKMMIIYDTISVNKWKLAAVFPEEDLINSASFIKNITLAVMFFLIITAILLSNLLAKTVTTPLTHLTQKVKQVKIGNLEVLFDVELPNEIGVLNSGIRELLSRVGQLLEQVRTEQEQKRLAELNTMQAQIKPHFLYNTLDSIKQLCEMGESKEAGAMVAALAKFFRISISGGRELISIREEIEHIQSYLLILRMRYADDFDYEIEIEPEVLDYQIIKLILQPLIENAIYHGIKEKRGKGILKVTGSRSDGKVILDVEDNGAGMGSETLTHIRRLLSENIKGPSFGLLNVHRRLQLHYGDSYGVEIDSELGKGTRVRITLPVYS